MKKQLYLDIYDLGLLSLCAFHFICNVIWITLSVAPVPWDQAGHTRLAMQFAQYYSSFEFLNVFRFLTISTYYPPLVHAITALPIALLDHPVQTSEMVITVFFVTTLVLFYIYATDLYQNKGVSLFGVTLFSFFPIIFEHSRWFLLEIPMLTFFLACLICLHRSYSFAVKRYVYGAFLFAAFAFLTKWLAVFYLAVPFIFALAGWYKTSRTERGPLTLIIKGCGLFLLVVLPWYLMNTGNVLREVPMNIRGESSDPQSSFTIDNLKFYAYLFTNFQLTIYGAIVFIASVILYIIKRVPYRLFFFSFLTFMYVAFTFVPNKDWRYTMPILPIVAIMMGVFLFWLWTKKIGYVIVPVVIGFFTVYFLILSFHFPISKHYQYAIKLPVLGYIDLINSNDNLAHAYNPEIWPQQKVLKAVAKASDGDVTVALLCLVDQERFNPGNLILERDILGLHNIKISSPPNRPFQNAEEIRDYINNFHFDYVVMADKKIGVEATRNIAAFYQLKDYLLGQEQLKEMQAYSLPNGDVIRLYAIIR